MVTAFPRTGNWRTVLKTVVDETVLPARAGEARGCRPPNVDLAAIVIRNERPFDETTREAKPTKTFVVRHVDLDHFPVIYVR